MNENFVKSLYESIIKENLELDNYMKQQKLIRKQMNTGKQLLDSTTA